MINKSCRPLSLSSALTQECLPPDWALQKLVAAMFVDILTDLYYPTRSRSPHPSFSTAKVKEFIVMANTVVRALRPLVISSTRPTRNGIQH